MSSLQSWDVFYVYVDQFQKSKYVVIVGEIPNSDRVGVLCINTDQVKNSNLQVCDVLIEATDHPFLGYSSYVSGGGLDGTGSLINVPKNMFGNRQGTISPKYRVEILDAINACPSVKQKTLNFINGCMYISLGD